MFNQYIWEAKRSITNSKEQNAARSQVRSYAKLLGAKYAAIVSQEQIWVFSSNVYELKKIIGK